MYKNIKNPIPKVVAIHDLSGFGRSSLTVVIPILSYMGIQVVPLPTAVLSAHGKYPEHHFTDLTNSIDPIAEHWNELGLEFECIYSGFLGSPEQADSIKRFIKRFTKNKGFVLVDPVLGDNGKRYPILDKNMVVRMKELLSYADIITPNITEVALLLDEPYCDDLNTDKLKTYAYRLADFGPEIVIITGVPVKDNPKQTSVVAYNKHEKRFWRIVCDYYPAEYPGTGDAFASVICGALIQGDSLPAAIDKAVHFISAGVHATYGYDYNAKEGILLEKVLPYLNATTQISTYELID